MKSLPPSKPDFGEPRYNPIRWNTGNVKNIVQATHNCYTYMLNDLYYSGRHAGKPQPGWYYVLNNNKKLDSYKINCSYVINGVLKDNKSVRRMSEKEAHSQMCQPGFYKGVLVVSPDNDYHFARQDNRMIKVYRNMKKHKMKVPNEKEYLPFIRKFIKICKLEIPIIYDLAISHGHVFGKHLGDDLKILWKLSFSWSHKPGAGKVTDKDADHTIILDPSKANWNFSKKGGINYNCMCTYFEIPSNRTHETFSSGLHEQMFTKKNLDNRNTRIQEGISSSHDDRIWDKTLRKVIASFNN